MTKALLLVLALVLAARCAYADWTAVIDRREIRSATTTYLQDMTQGDSKDAYMLLSPNLRAHCSEQAFTSLAKLFFERVPDPAAAPEEQIEDIEIAGNTATAKLVFDDGLGGDELSYSYVKEGPRWYILPPDLRC